nr:hypothetical protein [Nocardia jiangxiensis]
MKLVHDMAGCSADTGGQHAAVSTGEFVVGGVESGTLELADLVQRYRVQGVLGGQDAFGEQVRGDTDRGLGGAFGTADLKHVQGAAFDGELDVQDVTADAFQLGTGAFEFGVDLGKVIGQPRDRVGGADARDHVFTLGGGEELAEQSGFAGHRVAGEDHAGAGSFVEVAEHHRLHHDRGAQIIANLMQLTVFHRTAGVP